MIINTTVTIISHFLANVNSKYCLKLDKKYLIILNTAAVHSEVIHLLSTITLKPTLAD